MNEMKYVYWWRERTTLRIQQQEPQRRRWRQRRWRRQQHRINLVASEENHTLTFLRHENNTVMGFIFSSKKKGFEITSNMQSKSWKLYRQSTEITFRQFLVTKQTSNAIDSLLAVRIVIGNDNAWLNAHNQWDNHKPTN